MLMRDHKHRRGRPRKPLPSTTMADKPREERSYKDFFPDLDIREPLTILKVSPLSSLHTLHQEVEKPEPNRQEHKLPVASFQIIQQQQKGNQDYFERPDHYIRYAEPLEADLFNTIEYDMDEQDQVWLQIYNKERKKDQLGEISSELFEAMMDQIEKEWFNLVKNLPKKTAEEPTLPEDSKCAVCDDGECENSNAIVFCDGCNLAVHQDCYGIPYIPEGQWLCRKCMISPENPVSCRFCPNEGGAFKQTTTNQWGHLLCAIWIPELSLSNSVYMEPIDNIESIPKSRWKLTCYICKRKHGACIQCDNKHCFVAFHVTCARWARLCMRMKLHGTHYDGVVLKAYCDRHTPRDYYGGTTLVQQAQRWFSKHKHTMPRKRYVDEEEQEDPKKKKKVSYKAARAHQHHYHTTTGAPIAPEYILNKLEHLPCVQKETKVKKKAMMVASICKYWSLKRESRRGAPLLKRLHLEPWTASASQLKQSEVEKAQKASALMTLRADLERVRMLSEQVQKRERQKLERIRKQKAYLEMIFYPIECIIQSVLDQLIELDKKELFRYPVTKEIAPDYHQIIQQPMSFSDIIQKLSTHSYLSLDEFEQDLCLIWKNSMLYNKADTPYFKLAQKLEKIMQELLVHARASYQQFNVNHGLLNVEIDPAIFSYGQPATIPTQPWPEKRPVDIDQSQREPKRRRTSSVAQEEPKPKVKRVTRSATEKNKRSLRSRGVVTDLLPLPVKKRTLKPKKPIVRFVNGETVWAHVRGFPPHPAQIVDLKSTDKNVPERVADLQAEFPGKILVAFYLVSEAHTWGWMNKSEIHVFGQLETDVDMLLQAKKTKKQHRIREVKNGYRHACQLVSIDPEPALSAVFTANKK